MVKSFKCSRHNLLYSFGDRDDNAFALLIKCFLEKHFKRFTILICTIEISFICLIHNANLNTVFLCGSIKFLVIYILILF